jgi:hypothetical protein
MFVGRPGSRAEESLFVKRREVVSAFFQVHGVFVLRFY